MAKWGNQLVPYKLCWHQPQRLGQPFSFGGVLL